MGIEKAVLISSGPRSELTAFVATLDLARRACSFPVGPDGNEGLPSFIELWDDPARLRQIVGSWPFSARAWLVEENLPLAYERTWASGTPSPGVRMVSTIYRRDGMSRADFEKHWLGVHTKIAKSYTIPVWNYSQNIVRESLVGGADAADMPSQSDSAGSAERFDSAEIDGFVGMHFKSADEMRARWQDYPAEAEVGALDAAKFMNIDRSASMTAAETVWEA
jgi:hypothetical protein